MRQKAAAVCANCERSHPTTYRGLEQSVVKFRKEKTQLRRNCHIVAAETIKTSAETATTEAETAITEANTATDAEAATTTTNSTKASTNTTVKARKKGYNKKHHASTKSVLRDEIRSLHLPLHIGESLERLS